MNVYRRLLGNIDRMKKLWTRYDRPVPIPYITTTKYCLKIAAFGTKNSKAICQKRDPTRDQPNEHEKRIIQFHDNDATFF